LNIFVQRISKFVVCYFMTYEKVIKNNLK